MKTFRWLIRITVLILSCVSWPLIGLAQQTVTVEGDRRDVPGSTRGWVYVGEVATGNLVQLSAAGRVRRSEDGVTYAPEGERVTLPGRLLPSDTARPFGLAARITYSRTDPLDEIREDWGLGAEPAHCVARGGHLWLTYNDDRPLGNTGAFVVTVTVNQNCTEAPLPGPVPERVVGDLAVTGLEVTQAVQVYPDNSIPLIGYKRTLVRVYVRGVPGSAGPWNDVTARLTVRNISGNYAGQAIAERELLPITEDPRLAITAPANNDYRGRWEDSLNFVLDPDQTAPGVREFRVTVTSISQRSETDTTNNEIIRQFTFQPPINISVWGARYRTSSTPEASREAFSEAVDYTSAAFPVSSFNINPWPGHSYDRPTPLTFDNDPPGRRGSRTALAKMADWSFDVLGRTFGLMQRMAVITPEDHADGMQGWNFGRGRYSVSFAANTGVVGANLAHEIGHSYGRNDAESDPAYPHSDLTIGNHVGIRFGAWSSRDLTLTLQAGRQANGAASVFDFMSASNPAWTSPFTYCALLETFSGSQVRCPADTRRAARPSYVPGTAAMFNHARQNQKVPGANTNEQLWLYVGGWVMPDGTIDLRPFDTTSDSTNLAPEGKTFRASLESADGQVLREVSFDPMEVFEKKQAAPRPFRFFMPFDGAATRITFRREAASKVIAERRVSANAPEVELTEPRDGQTLKGVAKLRWTGSDSDGDQLTYSVDYSTDGGATWTRLQSEITSETAELDTDALAGSDQARVRVRVTDGVWSGEASVAVRIARKPPQLAIETSSISGGGSPAVLEARAFDYEDGALTDPVSFRWRSDRDGDLGSGRWLVVAKLTPGTHTITGTIRDSENNEASATTVIKVAERNAGKPRPAATVEKPSTPATFQVTKVELSPEPAKLIGPCPVTASFKGSITTNGAGTVSYTFIRSDGATAPVLTLDFKQAGTQDVSTTWTLGQNYEGWQAIRILSPNKMESSRDAGGFVVACSP